MVKIHWHTWAESLQARSMSVLQALRISGHMTVHLDTNEARLKVFSAVLLTTEVAWDFTLCRRRNYLPPFR